MKLFCGLAEEVVVVLKNSRKKYNFFYFGIFTDKSTSVFLLF